MPLYDGSLIFLSKSLTGVDGGRPYDGTVYASVTLDAPLILVGFSMGIPIFGSAPQKTEPPKEEP